LDGSQLEGLSCRLTVHTDPPHHKHHEIHGSKTDGALRPPLIAVPMASTQILIADAHAKR
jgi:hypothetical protein